MTFKFVLVIQPLIVFFLELLVTSKLVEYRLE